MRKPKSCWKCATDQPHPFRHWHIKCRMCGKFRVYRGPSCKTCHANARDILADIIGEFQP